MIHDYQEQSSELNAPKKGVGSDTDFPQAVACRPDVNAIYDRDFDRWDPPQPSRKRVTGIHRDIRTTQIDDDRIGLPSPYFDEPAEDVPGEQENDTGDRPDEITEDAYDN